MSLNCFILFGVQDLFEGCYSGIKLIQFLLFFLFGEVLLNHAMIIGDLLSCLIEATILDECANALECTGCEQSEIHLSQYIFLVL